MEISRDFNSIKFQSSKIFQTTCYDIYTNLLILERKSENAFNKNPALSTI